MTFKYILLVLGKSASGRTGDAVTFLPVNLHISMNPYSEKILTLSTHIVTDRSCVPQHNGSCRPFVDVIKLKT